MKLKFCGIKTITKSRSSGWQVEWLDVSRPSFIYFSITRLQPINAEKKSGVVCMYVVGDGGLDCTTFRKKDCTIEYRDDHLIPKF